MHYKLYIDIVFILQLTGNVYLLSLAGRVLECTATHRRILAGAVMGAVLSCIAIELPFGTVGVRCALSALPVSMCMLRLVYRISRMKKLLGAGLTLAGCGFFLGSLMIWILNRLRTVLKGSAGLPATLAAGYLAYRILAGLLTYAKRRRDSCLRTVEIRLPEPGARLRVRALVDTGNHLSDPISGAPVNLVGRKLARQLAPVFRPEKYHAVPFRSVGRDSGILEAYEIPEIIIETQAQTVRKEHVIVAVCDTGISEDSVYQMIMHPRLLEG